MYEQGETEMINTLTERERETLGLMAEGLSNKLIADRMGIAEHTAKFHVGNVCKKLGVSTRTEAAVMYVQAKAFEEGFAAGVRSARSDTREELAA